MTVSRKEIEANKTSAGGYTKGGQMKLPHPLKCSKCAYIAEGRANLNEHWDLNH